MSEILPTTGFIIPKNGDDIWGDENITGALDQANGVGFFPALNKALVELYETPEDIENSLLKLNAKLSAGEVGPEGEEYTQLLNTAQNIVKSIKAGSGITIQDFGNYIELVSSITNVANIFSVDANASFGYATIQAAATAAGAVATLAQPQTVIAYTGTYTENVNFPPFVNFYGIGTVKIIGKINFTSPGTNQNSIVQNVIIEHTATTSTDYAVNTTADGSVRLIGNQINTYYEGDFDVTSISVTGAATIQGRDNQIVTARIGGTSTTNREIIAINAPNVTGDILVKNGFTIAQTTTDENDNLTGLCLGGSAASHVANLLYLVNTTNASYSGKIRGLKYLSNTVNKTFGNMTFQIQDAGAGDFVFVDITADSGLFLGSNIEGYYNGSGTAYLGSVAAGATLAIGGGNQQGMTETFTGAGTAKGYALTNDIFDVHANTTFNNNNVTGVNSLSATSGTFSGNVTGANAITTQHLLPLGQANTNYIKASGETRDIELKTIALTRQLTGGAYTLKLDSVTGKNTAVVWYYNNQIKWVNYLDANNDDIIFLNTETNKMFKIDKNCNLTTSGTATIAPAISNTHAIQKQQVNSRFFLTQAANESETVSSTVYASPGDNITARNLSNFTYSGGSLTCNYAGTYRVTAEISYNSTGTNVITSFAWGKNWTSGLPSESADKISRKTSAADIPTTICTTELTLAVDDTLDLVAWNNGSSQTLTFQEGCKYYCTRVDN